jgi:hypothetical protein
MQPRNGLTSARLTTRSGGSPPPATGYAMCGSKASPTVVLIVVLLLGVVASVGAQRSSLAVNSSAKALVNLPPLRGLQRSAVQPW